MLQDKFRFKNPSRSIPVALKTLGQHYLFNKRVLSRIIQSIRPFIKDCQVIEIGPGPGTLTRLLLEENIRSLLLIEKDSRFLPLLENLTLSFPHTTSTILCQDALETDYPALAQGKKTVVIGNLPYNISVPLIMRWLEQDPWWNFMGFLVQKEVGQRLCAVPRTKSYSSVSVMAQSYAHMLPQFTVSPGAFTPPPLVESLWMHAVPRATKSLITWTQLHHVTSLLFRHRRKMLRSSLAHYFPGKDVSSLGIPETARPEELDVSTWHALTSHLYSF